MEAQVQTLFKDHPISSIRDIKDAQRGEIEKKNGELKSLVATRFVLFWGGKPKGLRGKGRGGKEKERGRGKKRRED